MPIIGKLIQEKLSSQPYHIPGAAASAYASISGYNINTLRNCKLGPWRKI